MGGKEIPASVYHVVNDIVSMSKDLQCLKLANNPPGTLSGWEKLPDAIWDMPCVNHLLIANTKILREKQEFAIARRLMRSRSALCHGRLQLYGPAPLIWYDIRELKKQKGAAPFTTLDICQFSVNPEAVLAIVQWCRKLEHFTFVERRNVHLTEPPGTPFFEWLLEPHCATLRSIKIADCEQRHGRPVIVSGSPVLDTLVIPWSSFSYRDGLSPETLDPPIVVDQLLAPQLRELTIVMTRFDEVGSCPGESHRTYLDECFRNSWA
ncbi:hypothetical protein P152DRAFT_1325 [Eremomyces bilateralis CBS 781.70]|uniref:F-box domain-containing protein n=1 Tax=Eremomyces bilateralis CBS 781.70 TaxID=1392243 RepID=A0A6G1GFV5_9PEZI|nr:uncharacterized protein P152DRAFT_1325 [Eremomyces bilateralis CBS 781.70]KAF1816806.1 hypothetical protein P152DRAFT_1325 [Eremomyces bilateralis CBS 781.70]